MTFVAGPRLSGMVAPWVLERAMNGDGFHTGVEKVQVPALKPAGMVIMDNLPAHKVAGIAELIRARKARTFHLPAYSPDMNPTGNAFAKLKTLAGTAKERSVDPLIERIGSIIGLITPGQWAGLFKNARYQHSS